jgi:hypothetical protein
MDIEELTRLMNSPAAPSDHKQYTIWLHDQIITRIVDHELSEVERRSLLLYGPDDKSNISKIHNIFRGVGNMTVLRLIKQ